MGTKKGTTWWALALAALAWPKAAAVTKTIAVVASNLSAVYLEQGRDTEIGSTWIKVDQGGDGRFWGEIFAAVSAKKDKTETGMQQIWDGLRIFWWGGYRTSSNRSHLIYSW